MTRRVTAACCLLIATVGALAGLTFAASAQAGFVKGFAVGITDEGKSPSTQAGAHPFEAANTITFTTKELEPGLEAPTSSAKNLITGQPLGLVGAPASLPYCSDADFTRLNPATFAEESCPNNSAIGVAEVELPFGLFIAPIFNLVPPPGQVAQFGFRVAQQNVRLIPTVDYHPGEGYGIDIGSLNTSQGLAVKGATIRLWGTPAAAAHSHERGSCINPFTFEFEGSCAPEAAEVPFLRNPTSCGGALRTTLEVNTWQEPDVIVPDEVDTPAMEGCSKLPFSPTIKVEPTTGAADSPTGLKVDVHMPQAGLRNPGGISESDLRQAVVTLPEGMAVNPSAAAGQAACSAAQIDLADGTAPASCPDASKIGTVEIDTPLLEKPLPGSVYLARQTENKFGSLLAIYVAVDDPQTGIVLKLPGKIEAGPSGQLTTSFAETPQLPFEDLQLEFFGGPRAPLVNPPSCGSYSAAAVFTPWSGSAPVATNAGFKVTSGPGGSPCPNGRFAPQLSAGSVNPVAGAYSPFVLSVSREDGTQRLGAITATLPKGLLAKLAGIPYCPEGALAAISGAEGTAAAQIAGPSCPAASQVGTVTVGAGAGSNPFFLDTGRAYLAGPYKGAPLSLAIVTPALAGPFDLGNVVIRTALRVNPETTQVTAVSDPLPTALYGIPLDLREVQVSIDRETFIRNPTDCTATQVTSTIASVGGATASPFDRFQVANCARLGFGPKLSLALKGGTRRGQNPALTATLATGKNEANIGAVSVALPRSEFLAQGHIGTVCTRVQFAEGAVPGEKCPKASVYGRATAITPLLEKPLRGPVYLRSSSHKLPDLVAALRGQINIDLDGRINSFKGGIQTSFEAVPDAPVTKFVLQMKGAKKSLLENSTDICLGAHRATVKMDGQNGRTNDFEPTVKPACRRPRL